MPFYMIVAAAFLGAIGILIGFFVTVNILSSFLTSTDEPLADAIAQVGTDAFDQPIANTATRRFTEKPKPATEAKKAEPKAAGESHGHAAAAAGHGDAAAPKAAGSNNTSLTTISKVWIEPGCIVCDACVQTCPEVFVIQGDTCIIVPTPQLAKVDEIKEAAAGCPVDVIRYS